MFDRGLLSVDQDFRILVASVPEEAARMLNSDGKVHVPFGGSTKPHQQFLEYHRRFVFKG
jgi:predicted restriction endonuclease